MDLMENSKFCLNMTNLEGKRALNRPGVLAGANFIALRRTVVHFNWLVETLQVILLGARRVGTGQIVEQAGRR